MYRQIHNYFMFDKSRVIIDPVDTQGNCNNPKYLFYSFLELTRFAKDTIALPRRVLHTFVNFLSIPGCSASLILRPVCYIRICWDKRSTEYLSLTLNSVTHFYTTIDLEKFIAMFDKMVQTIQKYNEKHEKSNC